MKTSGIKLWNECIDKDGNPSTELWLKQTGINTREFGFGLPQKFPYQCYSEEVETAGPDAFPSMLLAHNIEVEQYCEDKSRDHEEKLKQLLSAQEVDYFCERTWIDSEKVYLVRFEFIISEKKRKVN